MLITLLITYCKRVESIDIVPWRHTTSANRSTLPGKASYTYPEAIYIPKSKSPDYHVPYYINNFNKAKFICFKLSKNPIFTIILFSDV